MGDNDRDGRWQQFALGVLASLVASILLATFVYFIDRIAGGQSDGASRAATWTVILGALMIGVGLGIGLTFFLTRMSEARASKAPADRVPLGRRVNEATKEYRPMIDAVGSLLPVATALIGVVALVLGWLL